MKNLVSTIFSNTFRRTLGELAIMVRGATPYNILTVECPKFHQFSIAYGVGYLKIIIDHIMFNFNLCLNNWNKLCNIYAFVNIGEEIVWFKSSSRQR